MTHAKTPPEIIVSVGGGGVGKTTTSAALALSLARAGRRTLVVTIDPARRLADALGTRVGSKVQLAPLPGAEDRLFALMPEPRQAMRQFTEYLCADDPDALERLLNNRLYQVLEEAVPGIHELVCMSIVTRAAEELGLDTIVIDTAPSRYAIDFVTYPRRLGKLLGNRAIAWLSSLGAPESQTARSRPVRWLAWGRRRAEQALAGVLGPTAVTDVAELFAAMSLVRERFVELSFRASELLLVKQTRYLLVTAPTGAASDNVRYLHARLQKLKLTPVALIVNQGLDAAAPWHPLLEAPDLAPDLAEVLAQLAAERAARQRAAEEIRSEFARTHRRLPQIPLPYVEAPHPRDVVLALADPFTEHLHTVSARS